MYSAASFGSTLKWPGPIRARGPSASRTPRLTAAYMRSQSAGPSVQWFGELGSLATRCCQRVTFSRP